MEHEELEINRQMLANTFRNAATLLREDSLAAALADELDPPVVAPEGYELTGKCRPPKEGEWYLDDVNGAPYKAARADWDFKNTHHHILRKKYALGTLVVVDTGGLRYVTKDGLVDLRGTASSYTHSDIRGEASQEDHDRYVAEFGDLSLVALQRLGKQMYGKE